jgi:hypothetical protein
MKIELNMTFGWCRVEREPGDPAYYGDHQAAGESRLLYNMKKKLNAQGRKFIKTRMVNHGHMVDDCQQYLIEHKTKIAIYSPFFALRGANDDYNKGEVIFTVEILK